MNEPRDLQADLETCRLAGGEFEPPLELVISTCGVFGEIYQGADSLHFFDGTAEIARFLYHGITGWPHAIEQAIAFKAGYHNAIGILQKAAGDDTEKNPRVLTDRLVERAMAAEKEVSRLRTLIRSEQMPEFFDVEDDATTELAVDLTDAQTKLSILREWAIREISIRGTTEFDGGAEDAAQRVLAIIDGKRDGE